MDMIFQYIIYIYKLDKPGLFIIEAQYSYITREKEYKNKSCKRK